MTHITITRTQLLLVGTNGCTLQDCNIYASMPDSQLIKPMPDLARVFVVPDADAPSWMDSVPIPYVELARAQNPKPDKSANCVVCALEQYTSKTCPTSFQFPTVFGSTLNHVPDAENLNLVKKIAVIHNTELGTIEFRTVMLSAMHSDVEILCLVDDTAYLVLKSGDSFGVLVSHAEGNCIDSKLYRTVQEFELIEPNSNFYTDYAAFLVNV